MIEHVRGPGAETTIRPATGRQRVGGEAGAGSALAVALVAAVVALLALLLPLYSVFADRARVAGAADAGALAAADAVAGFAAGFTTGIAGSAGVRDPCSLAGDVAAQAGAALASCTVDGLVVTVVVSDTILGLTMVQTATAGPPPAES